MIPLRQLFLHTCTDMGGIFAVDQNGAHHGTLWSLTSACSEQGWEAENAWRSACCPLHDGWHNCVEGLATHVRKAVIH